MAAGIALLAVLILLAVFWVRPLNFLIFNILLVLLFAVVVGFIILCIIQLQKRVSKIEANAADDKRRSDAIFQLSRKFVEANDEEEVVSSLIEISTDLVGAVGASLVPIDERGQPMTAISSGDIPKQQMDAWVEYLASPGIRHSCSTCQQSGTFVHNCPLVEMPALNNPHFEKPTEVYCLLLQRGDREYGMLNLYLTDENHLDDENQKFLRALLDETALVMESLRLQKREMSMLRQLHLVRDKSELKGMEFNFLENVKDSLKADFVLLRFSDRDLQLSNQLNTGAIPEESVKFINGIIQGIFESGQPILLGDVEGDPESASGLSSMLAVPLLRSDGPPFGVIVAGNTNPHKFNTRHLTLLQILAGQISLVIQNSEMLAEFEFNTIIAERNRLAREIHDGLAQTLGFLKLQAAQMENFLAAQDTDRLQESLSSTYKVLSDAYTDVRQAIDGLRISPNGDGLLTWLQNTCIEFEENTGLKINLEDLHGDVDLPPEIQAQLIRIVQEALSNVRKHAQATQGWVVCRRDGNDFVIEIRDDGCGFSPEEIPSGSKYGLLGMRERSDLIGAEFQVISELNQGTLVRVSLPMSVEEVVE
jgi:two-component system nitrate/nitrite sensor histidine kinase NarX